MLLAIAAILTVGAVVFTLFLRSRDLPEEAPASPTFHLEQRKDRIYENLRDLQFEYRVGKLSDEDYQRTKLDLQRELAAVLAEIDSLQGSPSPAAAAKAAKPAPAAAAAKATAASARPDTAPGVSASCPHCGARFELALKFCGECGKPMRKEPA